MFADDTQIKLYHTITSESDSDSYITVSNIYKMHMWLTNFIFHECAREVLLSPLVFKLI